MAGMYSEQVLDHFQNPRFVGELADATVTVVAQNPACGDILRLCLKVANGEITDVRFRAKGCVPAIACGSKLAEMLQGKPADDAQIDRNELIAQLGGLPQGSEHASHLAMDALNLALSQLKRAAATGR